MKSFIDLIIQLEKHVRRLNGRNTIYFTHSIKSVDDARRALSAIRYWNVTSEAADVKILYALTSVDPEENRKAFALYCKSMKMYELDDVAWLSELSNDEYSRIIVALS